MSERENVRLIQDAYAAFGRGDIQAIIDACTDDVDWQILGPKEIPAMGARKGKNGVRDFFDTLASEDEVLQFEPQKFVAQGDTVVVTGHYKARFRHNNAIAESDWCHVFTIRDGSVASWRQYSDTAAFLEAYRAPATANASAN
jgi:ketosteroid isomerase-like protein